MIEMNVVDAGARYGLHPSWQPMEDLARFHLFETDSGEVDRLAKKYKGKRNITINNIALFSENTTLTFNERQHRALNSLYESNRAFLENENYMQEEHSDLGEYEVEARTIDSFFNDQSIHFLKLDVEGAELEVLKGSLSQLGNSVLAVRAEVFFAPLLQGSPMFGEVNKFLLDQGFELLNLDYDGRGSPKSAFTRPDRFGKLMSSDGVWTITSARLFDKERANAVEDTLRLSFFLMLNNATDVALEILLRAVEKEGLSFHEYSSDPLFKELNKRVALLFKDISYFPSMDFERLQVAYRAIFGKDFPVLNEFYESELFN